MAVPTFTKNPLQVKTGPGMIFFGTPSVTVPTFVAAASAFTNDWTGWGKVGYTDTGLTIVWGREAEDVEVAESLYPIRKVGTKANVSVRFDAAGINEDNMRLAQAGGTWSTVSGTGATSVRKYSPPEAGLESRFALGWLSVETDEVFIMYQGYQGGEVTMERAKGANKASLKGMNFSGEVPDPVVSTDVWNYWVAGVKYAPLV